MAQTLPVRLQDSPHAFLQPSLPLYTDTLAYLKHALDPLAAQVSSLQLQRQQEARKQRKRKRGDTLEEDDVLRLKQVHTEGFGPEQVWEQARRVIDAARREAERGLLEVQEREGVNGAKGTGDVEVDWEDAESEDDDLGEGGVDYEVEGPDVDGDEDAELDDLEDALDEADGGAQDDYVEDEDVDMDAEDILNETDNVGNEEPAEEFVPDKFGLNDGFFSIDDFNKRSEFLEQQDARGDNDGAASDEEEVDWDADPLAQGGAANGAAAEDDDEEDDEGGPTFGDPDAASEDDDDDLDAGEMDTMGGMGNTNSVMYADFFAPPAQKKRKNKKGRPNPHNFPAKAPAAEDAEDDDVERTMAAVHRDLFEDEDSAPEEEEDDVNAKKALDPSDPRARRSTHERRKLALAEEIRKLEAANVAKREWTLSGEARAADRPLNSLLEEDLEFERAGKPVPVITAEVSESIEALIKRRILAHDFQDISRRRPDDLATGAKNDALRRGRLADELLEGGERKKGLAEEYEDQLLRSTDPNYVDAKDEKTKKEEAEISALWNKIRSDLDGLSSWHFRPKAPAPQLEVRVDAPAITMEDARPSAGGEVASASMLAPQEVYKAGEGTKGVKEEVVGKSGLPAAREEMGREEKKRRRRREKERIRKAGGNGQSGEKKGGKKAAVVDDLKRGGVKVIGKKGQVTDVAGREAKGGSESVGGGGGRYKL